jgi:tetratricopeptide (TPR) repeat protein
MLRGQDAYFQGDNERALVELEQAVKLNPESPAPVALLALTQLGLYDFSSYQHNINRLGGLLRKSLEDYLFTGYAQMYGDRELGLSIMDEAVKKSRSPLARALRAELRGAFAEDQSNLEIIAQAINDIDVAREHMEDNPHVRSISVMTHLEGAILYKEAGRQDDQAAMLQDAERDARALARWPGLPYPSYARWKFFDLTDQQAQALEVARQGAESTTLSTPHIQYVLSLCRHGDFTEALREIDRRKRKSQDGEYLRAYILAELHPKLIGRARSAADAMSRLYTSDSGFDNYSRTLRFLGFRDEAIAATQKAKVEDLKTTDEVWLPLLKYQCGEALESDVLSVSGGRWYRFYSRYHIALDRLAVGDRAGAQQFLRDAIEHRLIGSFDTDLARTFLIRMDQDTNWPPWIPIKK